MHLRLSETNLFTLPIRIKNHFQTIELRLCIGEDKKHILWEKEAWMPEGKSEEAKGSQWTKWGCGSLGKGGWAYDKKESYIKIKSDGDRFCFPYDVAEAHPENEIHTNSQHSPSSCSKPDTVLSVLSAPSPAISFFFAAAMIIPFSDQKTEAWERVSDLTKVTQLVSSKGVGGMDGRKNLTKASASYLKNVITVLHFLHSL